jgi:hypothetical protein
MAGARPSSFKKGGGFLDGVDLVIKDYQFTDEFNGEAFKPGKIKGADGKPMEKPHTLNVLLTVRVDGADEDTTTTLKAANNFDDWTVSEDGYTIEPADGSDQALSAGTSFAKFITSLCEADARVEGLLPEDSINYQGIIGIRARTVQRKDEERTKKYGQKVDKKTGKGYDRKDLVVETVYELPGEGQPAAKSKPAAKGGAKAAPATKTAKGKAPAAPEVSVEDLAKQTLIDIATENKGSIAKSKISMKVLLKLGQHPQREDVRKLLFSDDFLAQEDGWGYDKAKQLVVVEVAEE